ncbi:hypothetical protein E4U53_007709 [Claviceps sorghi]|nr:hypothetical protein E4U53_007709 [Claviceps sorghi]
MKFSTLTTLLMAVGPALTADYTLTCSRGMYVGPEEDAQAYFEGAYQAICIKILNCTASATPALGSLGSLVNGGCVSCPDNITANAVGDCLVSVIKNPN